MANQKFSNADEAQAFIESTRDERKVAKEELKQFLKDNKLSPKEDHSEDKKHGKKYTKMVDLINNKTEALEKAEGWLKENKPTQQRPSIYDYPEGMTEGDKKKFRSQMRAKKKREEAAGESGGSEEEPKKKKTKKVEEEVNSEESKTSTETPKPKKKVKKVKSESEQKEED